MLIVGMQDVYLVAAVLIKKQSDTLALSASNGTFIFCGLSPYAKTMD